MREFSGGASAARPTHLTIPEQDARAPEEDWSAGLPLVLRGIQQKDWNGIAQGIVLSLEQTENYEQKRAAAKARAIAGMIGRKELAARPTKASASGCRKN